MDVLIYTKGMKHHMAPRFRDFFDVLEAHPIHMSILVGSSGEHSTHIGLGLCAYTSLIEAYSEEKIIDDRTWHLLHKASPADLPVPRWVPFISAYLDTPLRNSTEIPSPLRSLETD